MTGTLEKGKAADMIVTKENPLDDLKALRHVDMVVASGRLIRNPRSREENRSKQSWINFCKPTPEKAAGNRKEWIKL